VSARCASTEPVVNQKSKKDSLKVCVGGSALKFILFRRNN
jgi:hypothetical protein